MTRSTLRCGALLLAASLVATAAPGLPIISEYIEGSQQNQAIEIFNPDAAPVDLSGFTIEIYNNGNATPDRTIVLSGILAAGDVFVVARSQADPPILAQADLTTNQLNFNGDDAIVLTDGTSPLDRVGQVGFDPGTQWGSGLTSTRDNTLRRNPGVTVGDPNLGAAFDPSAEWIGFPSDTVDGLGAPPVVVPEVSAALLTGLGLVGLAVAPRRRLG